MIRVGCVNVYIPWVGYDKILALQGGIQQIIGPAGRDMTSYLPFRAGYDKLSALSQQGTFSQALGFLEQTYHLVQFLW